MGISFFAVEALLPLVLLVGERFISGPDVTSYTGEVGKGAIEGRSGDVNEVIGDREHRGLHVERRCGVN